MHFEVIHQATASVIVGTLASLGSFAPTQPLISPTPSPSPKPPIQQEIKITAPEVTVERFIGPTLPEAPVEKEIVKAGDAEKVFSEEKILAAETKPTETPTPTPTPSSTPVASSGGSQNFELIWQMIQNHRAKIGLAPFEKDERLCKIAEARAPQLQNEIFGSGTMHQGMRDMNLPYWNTENIVAYESEQKNFEWWMSDYIHRKAIESDNKYSCGTCLGNACVQEFSSFIPK